MFPLICLGFWPVKLIGDLGRNLTIFDTRKAPVSGVRARRVLSQAGWKDLVFLQCSSAVIDLGCHFAAGHVVLLA